MTTTILTDMQIINAANGADFESMVTADDYIYVLARAIEQAVLQSTEVQAWKKGSAMMDWLDSRACCADWVEGEPIKRVIQHEDGDEFYGATWRDAIDAAMEKKP